MGRCSPGRLFAHGACCLNQGGRASEETAARVSPRPTAARRDRGCLSARRACLAGAWGTPIFMVCSHSDEPFPMNVADTCLASPAAPSVAPLSPQRAVLAEAIGRFLSALLPVRRVPSTSEMTSEIFVIGARSRRAPEPRCRLARRR